MANGNEVLEFEQEVTQPQDQKTQEATQPQEVPQISAADFAQMLKQKFPDYAEVDDDELVARVLEKHPEYIPSVKFDTPTNEDGDVDVAKMDQQVLKGINTTLLHQAKIPEQLHGLASAVNESVFSIASGVKDFTKAAAFRLDDDVQKELKGAPLEQRAELWNNYWDGVDYVNDLASISHSGTAASKYKISSPTELISQGEYGMAAELVTEQVAAAAVSLTALLLPGGVAALGTGAAGQAFDKDIGEQHQASIDTLIGAALFKGGNELVTEMISARLLGFTKMGSGGVSALTKALENITQKAGLNSFGVKEGITEGVTGVINKFIDTAFYGTPGENYVRDFMDDALIAAIAGESAGRLRAFTALPEPTQNSFVEVVKDVVVEPPKAKTPVRNIIDEVLRDSPQEKTPKKQQRPQDKTPQQITRAVGELNSFQWKKLSSSVVGVKRINKSIRELSRLVESPDAIDYVDRDIILKKHGLEDAEAVYEKIHDFELAKDELVEQTREMLNASRASELAASLDAIISAQKGELKAIKGNENASADELKKAFSLEESINANKGKRKAIENIWGI